jgi:AcrR family transcriptional regulator
VTAAAEPRASRDRLVAATLAILDEEGYRRLRVADVARRAGLTTGAIYGIFRTKHALVAAALHSRQPDAVRAAARPAAADPAVLDAALEALDEHGYAKVRLDQVARGAGVPTAAVRQAFPTKHHLLAAAIMATAPAEYADAIADLTGGPPPDRKAAGLDATTRDRLLDAALDVVNAAGYRDARLVDIARKAGMTTGAVYTYFGSKHDLLDAAMAKRYGDLYRSALAQTRDGPDALMANVTAQLRQDATVDHRAMVELFALASRHPEAAQPLVQELARRHRDIAALIEENKASGTMRADIPTDGLAHLVQLLALGNLVALAVGADRPTADEIEITLQLLPTGITDTP